MEFKEIEDAQIACACLFSWHSLPPWVHALYMELKTDKLLESLPLLMLTITFVVSVK